MRQEGMDVGKEKKRRTVKECKQTNKQTQTDKMEQPKAPKQNMLERLDLSW